MSNHKSQKFVFIHPVILILNISLFLFSGCLTFEKPSETPVVKQDMHEFSKNHVSKNKKIFLSVECHHFLNGEKPLIERNEDAEMTKIILNKLKEVQFSEVVAKKEDADFIVKTDISVFDVKTKILTFFSALTLFIVPSKEDITINTKVTVFNVKTNETKEFNESAFLTMWRDLIFLPVRFFYQGRNQETINRLDNFIYKIGNDEIWKEKNGLAGAIRTRDHRIRNPMLYPAELRPVAL